MSPTPPPSDGAVWRNRFIIINLTRIGFTILVIVGLLLWQSDTFVEGGSIAGFPMAVLGVIASFAAPNLLMRKWRTPPEQ